jgi:hypothetical protein
MVVRPFKKQGLGKVLEGARLNDGWSRLALEASSKRKMPDPIPRTMVVSFSLRILPLGQARLESCQGRKPVTEDGSSLSGSLRINAFCCFPHPIKD